MIVRILLVTSAPDVKSAVQTAIGAVSNCELVVAEGLTGFPDIQQDISLVIFHQTGDAGYEQTVGLLQQLAGCHRAVPTVVISDDHEPRKTLELLRRGVADCLSRPLDINRLAYLIDVLTCRQRYRRHCPQSTQTSVNIVENQLGDSSFLFDSSSGMGTVMEQIHRVAPLLTTVLLTGETGTGKTRLARLIHELSSRREKPFIALNCGSLAPTLIESELFGHRRGAFTGADRDHEGKFEAAAGGTLLLDEIDSLPLETQPKLLRAIDERAFERVGSNQSIPLQARLVVATNRDLNAEAAAGRFRSDLYYRVNVVTFHLPPLRERRSLIRPLAERCLAEFADRNGREAPMLSAESISAIEAHEWPGNIRELRNAVERAASLCDGDCIRCHDLPQHLRSSMAEPATTALPVANGTSSSRWLQGRMETEIKVIQEALSSTGNNRARAAEELGISRVTLYRKLHKYGLI